MTIPYIFIVDLARPARTNTVLIKQGDSNSRSLEFVLMHDTRALNTKQVIAVTVSIHTPDGSTIADVASLVPDSDGNNTNHLVYTLPGIIGEQRGTSDLTFSLIGSDDSVLETFDFYAIVRNELYELPSGVGQEGTGPDLSGLRDLISRAEAATSKIEAMTMSSTLPNPFPLRLDIDGTTYEYNGSSTQEITVESLTYLSDIAVTTTAIEWPLD